MQNILILSTRTTVIGTFRKDGVYELDDKDQRVANVIASLTSGKNPAAKTLTDQQVKARAKAVKSVVPKPEGTKAEIKVKDAQAGEAAANERAEKAVAAETAAKTAADEAIGREKEALEREAAALALAKDATSEVEKLSSEKDGLAGQLEALQTELAALKKDSAK